MKTIEKQRQSDYILLHTLIGKYLDICLADGSLAPRYSTLERIKDVVNPFYEMKRLIQRIEWLDNEEDIAVLIECMRTNDVSMEELKWAVAMFAIQQKMVFNKIEKRICADGR